MPLTNNQLNMFTVLGLTEADDNVTTISRTVGEAISEVNKKPRSLLPEKAQFLKITLDESYLMNPKKKKDEDRYKIVLPYHHDKSIQDALNAKITNNWESINNGTVGSFIARKVQDFTATSGFTNTLLAFMQDNVMFKYDGGSTKKTLNIPFIVPLGMATKEKLEKGAAQDIRFIFNKLQGLLYPNDSIAYMPPLMEVSIGGMYQSFYGFVTAVNIKPTNPDMFQEPYSGQYFHLVYDGMIQFENLFTYYHGEDAEGKWNIDNTEVEVLFGRDSYRKREQDAKTLEDRVHDYAKNSAKFSQERMEAGLSNIVDSRIHLANPETVFQSTKPSAMLNIPKIFKNNSEVANLIKQLNGISVSNKDLHKMNDLGQNILADYCKNLDYCVGIHEKAELLYNSTQMVITNLKSIYEKYNPSSVYIPEIFQEDPEIVSLLIKLDKITTVSPEDLQNLKNTMQIMANNQLKEEAKYTTNAEKAQSRQKYRERLISTLTYFLNNN